MAKKKQTTHKKRSSSKEPSGNVSVLIADDEPNMRKTLSAILRREGYDVETAADGETAVQMCARRAFDVVLLDVRMPGINGVEAFRRIRRHREGVRVILMSAYGLDELKQAALDEGAIAFLDKPLDVNKVVELISQATETAILVVEDDAETAVSLSTALEDQGCHVTVVHSPHDALEMVEQIKFDIVFIDVNLPVMNGLDLYLAIKKTTPTSVAIIITGMEKEFQRLAREAVRQTAYTIIHKPLDLDHLLTLLQKIKGQTVSDAIQKPQNDATQSDIQSS
ncbi:MAG: response regulator [Planctomycetes bacterium]|nr:response regulator [Planctomycetota bacterium]